MKISVFGIGYVGAVAVGCLTRDGHSVIAVDVSPDKVGALNEGRSPIVEPGLDELLREARAKGRLIATTDFERALIETDISFVCVGTPAEANGAINLDYVFRVSEQIGSVLAKKDGHSVVMRSTMLPGTMDDSVIPLLETKSGKKAGVDFGIAYHPEFLREGSAIKDYDEPGAIIFGARDLQTVDKLNDIYSSFRVAPRVMEIKAAEAVKYTNNAWHALKVSFANEIGLICKAMKVDSHDIMDALCSDTKLNISPSYLLPGFAFGGSCLPKDLKALRYSANRLDVETPILSAILTANVNQIRAANSMIEASGKRRIGIIGLSFKPETDDLRYSPLVELAENLIGRGYAVRIFDPIVQLSRVTGANRQYLDDHLPHIAALLVDKADDLISHSEVLVIGNRREAAALLPAMQGRETKVIDLVRIHKDQRTSDNYEGICW